MNARELEEEIRSIQLTLAVNTYHRGDVILDILMDRLDVLIEQHHELIHGASSGLGF